LEINTRIFTLDKLKRVSMEPYDAIYLGDPFAPEYPGNLCFEENELSEAVRLLKESGKKAYISTFSVPRNRDLPAIEKLLRFISREKLPVDAIEAHNTGVLNIIREILPGVPIYMGCLSNIYTDSTVNLLKKYGVMRVVPSYELSLDELEIIKNQCKIEVEILVHGRMILGVSEECPAVWWYGEQKAETEGQKSETEKNDCSLCREIINLSSERMDLTVRGRTTLSGKDVCMMEHIPMLLDRGFEIFHIDTSVGNDEYFETAGRLYQQAIQTWRDSPGNREKLSLEAKDSIDRLRQYNTGGFCNGYYFKTSGSEYVAARIHE